VLTQAPGDQGVRYGNALVNVGAIGTGVPLLAIANTGDAATVAPFVGTTYVQAGEAAAGPFGKRSVLYSATRSNIGRILFGGGVPGVNSTLSIIGGITDSSPDVGVGGPSGSVYILEASKVMDATMPLNVDLTADVVVALPADWRGSATSAGGLVPDINGDRIADFALCDSAMVGQSGRVVVFW
jgi:hypothetical protein